MPLIQGIAGGKGRLHAGNHISGFRTGNMLPGAATGVGGAGAGGGGVHGMTLEKRPVTGGADLAKPWAKTIFAHLYPTPATIKNQVDLGKFSKTLPPNTTL